MTEGRDDQRMNATDDAIEATIRASRGVLPEPCECYVLSQIGVVTTWALCDYHEGMKDALSNRAGLIEALGLTQVGWQRKGVPIQVSPPQCSECIGEWPHRCNRSDCNAIYTLEEGTQ